MLPLLLGLVYCGGVAYKAAIKCMEENKSVGTATKESLLWPVKPLYNAGKAVIGEIKTEAKREEKPTDTKGA